MKLQFQYNNVAYDLARSFNIEYHLSHKIGNRLIKSPGRKFIKRAMDELHWELYQIGKR